MIGFANTSGRVSRLLRLASLLQGGAAWTANELMDVLSVSRRTFYRDLKCLNEIGVAVSYQNGIGYKINGGGTLDQCGLETAEVLGLMFLGKLVRSDPCQPMINHALTAIYRLINIAHPDIRAACNDLMSCISIHTQIAPAPAKARNYFLTLLRLIDAGHTCAICKAGTGRDDHEVISLRPLRLELHDNGWSISGEAQPDGLPLTIQLADIIEIDNETLMSAAS